MRCRIAVPDDDTAWDLVDAAGICVRGFQMLQPESERLPLDRPFQGHYVANPLKDRPAGAPLRVGPAVQVPAPTSVPLSHRPPRQTPKLARSDAVRAGR